MIVFTRPVTEIILARASLRTYAGTPIDPEKEARLKEFISSPCRPPFGTKGRFLWLSARQGDAASLTKLGTYGVIRQPAGFIVGAIEDSGRALEDFGYVMETSILVATDLGLGTCWLGGSFRKSRFAEAIEAGRRETIPAVVSVGIPAGKRSIVDASFRRIAASGTRMPWDRLFFSGHFGRPLLRGEAGAYATALEMVRLGPSASNKQPWRIVKEAGRAVFHFYLRRTKGYDKSLLIRKADLQRVDMGIAMCHFALTAGEMGLSGTWEAADPGLSPLPPETAPVVSWRGSL